MQRNKLIKLQKKNIINYRFMIHFFFFLCESPNVEENEEEVTDTMLKRRKKHIKDVRDLNSFFIWFLLHCLVNFTLILFKILLLLINID